MHFKQSVKVLSTDVRSVDENWTLFHKQYLWLIEDHVPKKTLSTKSYLPWMNITLKQLLKKNNEHTIVLRNASIRRLGWIQKSEMAI